MDNLDEDYKHVVDYGEDFLIAMGQGVYTVGEDMALGFQRTAEGLGAGEDGQIAEIGYENRVAFWTVCDAIKFGFTDPRSPLNVLILTIIEEFFSCLPEEVKDTLAEKSSLEAGLYGAKMIGRSVIGVTLVKKSRSALLWR